MTAAVAEAASTPPGAEAGPAGTSVEPGAELGDKPAAAPVAEHEGIGTAVVAPAGMSAAAAVAAHRRLRPGAAEAAGIPAAAGAAGHQQSPCSWRRLASPWRDRRGLSTSLASG